MSDWIVIRWGTNGGHGYIARAIYNVATGETKHWSATEKMFL